MLEAMLGQAYLDVAKLRFEEVLLRRLVPRLAMFYRK